MQARSARTLLVALLLGGSTLAAWADRRVALVLAADDYKMVRPLDNAVDDAMAMEETLKKLGFEVFLETNRDLRRTRRALEDFREDAAGSDVALIFFAGHGVELGGENRLLPTDASADSVDALKNTTLPLEELRQTVNEVGRIGLIVLDACRNDPFGAASGEGRGVKALAAAKSTDIKPGLGRMGRAENVLFTFSAAPGQTAADGDGDNSPFTTALTKYLATDGLEIRSVMTLVQQEVYDLSRGKQLPYVESGLPQMFFATQSSDELPERERLLLAMADVTPDLRTEIETLASTNDMPLAPLYAALISSDAGTLSREERSRKLGEAADAFVATRSQIRTLASADPAVTRLRGEAEAQLSLGAFDTARGKLSEAAAIDSSSRETLKANFVERTLSEATTHMISGGTSRADLKYELAIASYARAVALFAEVGPDQLPAEQRQRQIESLETLGDLHVTVGNLAGARKAFESGRDIASASAAAEPGDMAWKSGLAAATLKLGDVQRDQGDSAGALASYGEGLEVRKAVAAADPQDSAARGLEAAAELKVGALHKLQGNVDLALASYQAGRDIALQLVETDASREEWQATLADSYRLVGEIQQERRDLAAARASYEAGVDLARKLAEARPHDALRQFELASAYRGLGYVQFLQGRDSQAKDTEKGGQEALASYDAAVAITRRLIEADPRNTAWQSGLASALEQIGEATYFGDNLITKEDADKSLEAYKSAMDIRERLVGSDPTNKAWVADLVTSYEKMATWYEFIPDDVTAIGYSKRAHEAVLSLAALDPQNVEWQRNATMYHAKLAGSYVQLDDYANALAYDQAGLAFAGKVADANPDKQVYQSDVIVFHRRVAFDKQKLNDYPGFFAQNDLRLEAAKKYAEGFPDNVNSLRDLYEAYIEVADTYTKNFPDDALGLYDQARVAAAKAVAVDPENPETFYGLYNTRLKAAYVLEGQGDRTRALAAYEAALGAIDGAVALKPQDVVYTSSRDHVLARIDGVRN